MRNWQCCRFWLRLFSVHGRFLPVCTVLHVLQITSQDQGYPRDSKSDLDSMQKVGLSFHATMEFSHSSMAILYRYISILKQKRNDYRNVGWTSKLYSMSDYVLIISPLYRHIRHSLLGFMPHLGTTSAARNHWRQSYQPHRLAGTWYAEDAAFRIAPQHRPLVGSESNAGGFRIKHGVERDQQSWNVLWFHVGSACVFIWHICLGWWS